MTKRFIVEIKVNEITTIDNFDKIKTVMYMVTDTCPKLVDALMDAQIRLCLETQRVDN
jgi:hypothetical protein